MQKTDKEVLKSISSENIMAFYLDSKNINNQPLVQRTITYIQTYRSKLFTPVEFLNLLWKQYNFVLGRPDTSEYGGQPAIAQETLNILKSLPLTSREKHILFCFIVMWYGGIGSFSHGKILRLIENEFKAYKGNTPEKKIYFKDSPQYTRLTFRQFANLKQSFEKLSYPEKLTFWDENIYKDTHYTFSGVGLSTGKEYSDEYTISIFPNNITEQKLHNQWLYDHIQKEYPNVDFEQLKKRYFDNIKNNPRSIEYTEQEIADINMRKSRQKTLHDAKNGITLWGYYCGYQSVVRNENTYLTLTAEDFKKIAEEYIKGRNAAYYLGFLETQLRILHNELQNGNAAPKVKEDINVNPAPKVKLSDIFITQEAYHTVMNLLIHQGYCQRDTFKWKDAGKGNKGLLIAILKDLRAKGYYKEGTNPSKEDYQRLAKNTFDWMVAIDTIKKAKPEGFSLHFIPVYSAQ